MQTDIVQLLANIKTNIAAVEQGERRAAVLDEIEADCVHMLELMKLFLISERDSYYGYFLMNLTYDVDFSSRSIWISSRFFMDLCSSFSTTLLALSICLRYCRNLEALRYRS